MICQSDFETLTFNNMFSNTFIIELANNSTKDVFEKATWNLKLLMHLRQRCPSMARFRTR